MDSQTSDAPRRFDRLENLTRSNKIQLDTPKRKESEQAPAFVTVDWTEARRDTSGAHRPRDCGLQLDTTQARVVSSCRLQWSGQCARA